MEDIMGLNAVPSGERIHIGFFGLRNAGKSSLVNAVTGQELSLVSDIAGTTTDPVRKAMELLPLGPIVIIDTPGIDDEGTLGEMRVRRAREVLEKTDVAVLVTEAGRELVPAEAELIQLILERRIPLVIARNKNDLFSGDRPVSSGSPEGSKEITVSAVTGENITELKELLASLAQKWEEERKVIVSDLFNPGDTVVLVVPIDESAPKGRLILPQQQVMRDILDAHGKFIVCQPEEVPETLAALYVKPRLVITDSQAFGRVSKAVPEDILLTSFSILFARYKGELNALVKGASVLSRLTSKDKVLISEGCTHHRQCNDIGTVKMPGWIRAFSGADPEFDFTSGGTFPEDLSKYSLIVHCGGCMLNDKEMKMRMARAASENVPIVNYGIAIAHMHGILKRSLEPFGIT